MMFGFWMARRLPVWASLALVAAFDVTVGAITRDNLTLNVLMLIHRVETIRRWQLGA